MVERRKRGRQPAEEPLQAVLAQAPRAALLEGQLGDGGALGQTRHNQLVRPRHREGEVQAAVGNATVQRAAAAAQRQPVLLEGRWGF